MSNAQPTFDDVWRLFQETAIRFQETDRKFQETDRLVKELSIASKETDRKFQETDRRFQETEKLIKESFQETDRKFKETEQLINKQASEIKELEKLFVGQWGKLMESLVEGDLVGILNQYGLTVLDTSTRLKGRSTSSENYEFDIIAHNGEEIVVVEVKTTLKPNHVKVFLKKLDKIKEWLPRYGNNRIYGAIAYLTADAGAETMAEHRGLLVIRATGNSASIINATDFRPRSW